MEKKMFHEIYEFEDLESFIGQYMEQELLKMDADTIEKWNYLAVLPMKDDEVVEKFMELVKMIDDFSLDEEKKIQSVLTLTYLILKEDLDILKTDMNSLLLMIFYLNTVSLEDVHSSITYINNSTILEKVRMKSLDFDVRVPILRYIDKSRATVEQVVQWIDKIEYYDLLKLIGV